MPDEDAIKFECPHCAQSIEAPVAMRGMETQCPTCGRTVQIPTPQKAAPQPPRQPTPRHESFKRGPATLWNVVLLFAIVTGGVYCGERLAREQAKQNPDIQYEYRLDTIDPKRTFFSAGRDLIEAEMNRYKGEGGWELKGIIPATRKGETQSVLVYCKVVPMMSPIMREIVNNRLKKDIEEAITNSSNQESEREKAEFEDELKRIGH
jgi:hypothetical protein